MFHAPESRRTVKKGALLLYTAVMLLLLFKRSRGNAYDPYWTQMLQQINLVPFRTIRLFLQSLLHGGLTQKCLAVINLIGNVIMFVPFGLLLPDLYQSFRPFFRFFLKCLALICMVEILQLVTLLGILDIDDVILNMVGFSLGYGITKIIPKGDKQNEQR